MQILSKYAGVAELADAQDLKSWVPRGACGFKTRPRQTTKFRMIFVARRSGNLEIARVPRTVAMKMVGHKTESIYRRYAIVDEAQQLEAAQKLNALHKMQWAR